MEEEKKTWQEDVKKETEKQMKNVLQQGVNPANIKYLSDLIDIYKDLSNVDYWKEKIKMYGNRYSGEYGRDSYNEGSYGRRRRDSRGRFMEGNFGERGYGANYRGEEYMENMYRNYQDYSEGRENYGADDVTLESLSKMLQSTKDFLKMLKKDAKSQEEVEMIKQTAKEISMM